jgi:hypothetical protein
MAKEIIVLDVSTGPGGDLSVNVLAWFAVPVANQAPKPGAASLWRGAAAADTANLQSGAVLEESYNFQFAQGTTKVAIQAYFVNAYNARAAVIAALPNPNQFYGVFFDSVTGWSA